MPVADRNRTDGSYLREYYSNADDEEEFDIPYDVPDAKLAEEWEERLRAYEDGKSSIFLNSAVYASARIQINFHRHLAFPCLREA